MQAASHMYADTKTWSPFKGCNFGCTYCVPSFQQQAKRQKHRCARCYRFDPHTHQERLSRIPSAEIVFVAASGDISFCDPTFTRQIIKAIRESGRKSTFYLQSKRPSYFEPFLAELPETVILVTTLETNRDEGYDIVSKAPPPSDRYAQFRALHYPRKIVTVEPVMDFDVDVLAGWIVRLKPECIWLGYNSRPKAVQLPEPTEGRLRQLARTLSRHGIPIREKELRGFTLL